MTIRTPSETLDADSKSPVPLIQLPTLTALQFLVLDLLSSESTSVSAHHLKRGLAPLASSYDGPKFYQLMGRLVRDGLISSEARSISTPGGTVERTFYATTERGYMTMTLARTFYRTRHRLNSALTDESTT